MHDHAANGVGIAQAGELPGLSGVRGFVHSVTGHDVAANAGFAGSDIDDVGVGRRDGDRAHGRRGFGKLVPERVPVESTVGCLPHASGNSAKVIRVILSGDTGDGEHAASAEGADQAILHAFEWSFGRLRLGRGNNASFGRKLLGCFRRGLASGGGRSTGLGWFVGLAFLRCKTCAENEKDNQKADAIHA